MKVPGIEDLVMSAYKELNRKKEKLKVLENDPRIKVYTSNIDVFWEIDILKNSIEKDEDLLNKYKSTIRDQKLNQLGI